MGIPSAFPMKRVRSSACNARVRTRFLISFLMFQRALLMRSGKNSKGSTSDVSRRMFLNRCGYIRSGSLDPKSRGSVSRKKISCRDPFLTACWRRGRRAKEGICDAAALDHHFRAPARHVRAARAHANARERANTRLESFRSSVASSVSRDPRPARRNAPRRFIPTTRVGHGGHARRVVPRGRGRPRVRARALDAHGARAFPDRPRRVARRRRRERGERRTRLPVFAS